MTATGRKGGGRTPHGSPRSHERREESDATVRRGAHVPGRLAIPAGREGSEQRVAVVERNADEGVTWLHSYVTDDGTKSFCIYEAPSPEAIRKTAARNDLPVDRITQVRVLDPYPYGGAIATTQRIGEEHVMRRTRVMDCP